MKRIVILDGFSINNGEFSWESLSKIFDKISVYDRTEESEILGRVRDADCILTCKTPLNRGIISECNNLKYIGSMATGFNHIDIDFCKSKNILVTNVPDYSTNAVSELTIAFLFEAFRKVSEHNRRVQQGEWINSKDFCFYSKDVWEIANKTMGIIGYGNIGKKVSKIAQIYLTNVR